MNIQAYEPENKFKGIGDGKINKTALMYFPIAGTEVQEKEISDLVVQILDDPDSPKVRELEQEINQLVYKLYELTPAEIKLIEKETTK